LNLLHLPDPEADLTLDTLTDPNRPEVQILLYFYSIEPPFYQVLNTATKLQGKAWLDTMGAFARAL